MKINLITLLLCFSAFSFSILAQDKPVVQPTPKDEQTKTETKPTAKDYENLLAKLKSGDTRIDYKALRMAYTETEDYSPYGIDADERTAIFKALNDKKYKDVIKAADKVLAANYVEMNAHYASAVANGELGDTKKADFHKAVFLGLIDSIVRGKDGKTAKTAYEVICVPEEYMLLNYFGYRRGSQALANENGSKFDILTVTDPEKNETFKLYFNIDIVWKGYEKVFGK